MSSYEHFCLGVTERGPYCVALAGLELMEICLLELKVWSSCLAAFFSSFSIKFANFKINIIKEVKPSKSTRIRNKTTSLLRRQAAF